MTKSSGLGQALYQQGVDISGDTLSIDGMTYNRNLDDVTGINKSAHERLPLLASGVIDFTCAFDPTVEHPLLSALPTADQIVAFQQSATLGDVGWGIIGKLVGYPVTRDASGSMRVKAQIQSNGFPGPEWGQSLTAGIRTDTSATSPATGVDMGSGSTSFGAVFYLEVLSITGTSVTVTIKESSDDAATDPYAAVTGGAFTAASAVGAQRIQTSLAQTVERYLKADTTGVFSNAQFVVVAKRYASAGAELA